MYRAFYTKEQERAAGVVAIHVEPCPEDTQPARQMMNLLQVRARVEDENTFFWIQAAKIVLALDTAGEVLSKIPEEKLLGGLSISLSYRSGPGFKSILTALLRACKCFESSSTCFCSDF